MTLSSVTQIDHEFVRSITIIERSDANSLIAFQNKLRFKIYKFLNALLPRYLELKAIDHSRLLKHMTHLKRQYVKGNYVNAINSNLFKLTIMFGLVYFAVPQEVSAKWLAGVQKSFSAFKKFIKESMSGLKNANAEEFFNSFTELSKDMLKIFYENTIELGINITSVLLSLLYMLNMLFLVELAVLLKIVILDAFEAL